MKHGHLILIKSYDLCLDFTGGEKGIVFVWVPGHVGVSGNSAAVSAAKAGKLPFMATFPSQEHKKHSCMYCEFLLVSVLRLLDARLT